MTTTKNTITRFYKNTRYMGVNYQAKDTMGEWRREINLHAFYGRPYNRFEYDEIYEYTPTLWKEFVARATEQARATNREVYQGGDFLYLVPIWIHGVRQPWQMTNEQYITDVIIKGNPTKSPEEIKRIIGGIPGSLRQTEHKTLVQQALAEGKPVPPEVLADYPDLKPAPTPTTGAVVTPPVKPAEVTPPVTEGVTPELNKPITANRNNIRAWFREPANWENKERLTYREVAEQISRDKDLIFKAEETPIDPSKPLGETKTTYYVELDGKKLREFSKAVYDYHQSLAAPM